VHRYLECFEPAEERYDTLLDDYERGMRTAEVRAIFDILKRELIPLIAELRERDDPSLHDVVNGDFPLELQREIAHEVICMFGFRDNSWRLDPTMHPFASGGGVDDIRLTTNYNPRNLESLMATMHEYGHGLYEHQVARELDRTPLGSGVSLGLHESQSRMWENLVGRSLPFWRHFYPDLRATYPESLDSIELEDWYRDVNWVEPSLIRVEADELTYNLHVILRFELEQELLAETVSLDDLPEVWNQRMEEYLGVRPPNDALGVLQDMHWAVGAIGYFSTYALGNVVSGQLWEKLNADLPDLAAQIEQGEFGALAEWLRERLWRHGRKFMPRELVERITGGGLDPEPYLRYLNEKYPLAD
jgi:carboxypeptidase Taq